MRHLSHIKFAIRSDASETVFSPLHFKGGRAFGPPLCGGDPPQRPPPKPRLIDPSYSYRRGGRRPDSQTEYPLDGKDKELVKSETVCGLVAISHSQKQTHRTGTDSLPIILSPPKSRDFQFSQFLPDNLSQITAGSSVAASATFK